MKTTINKEVEVKYLRVHIPVRYDEEDIPKDFPLRVEVENDKYGYDWWDATSTLKKEVEQADTNVW